jgi:hypothetical protein
MWHELPPKAESLVRLHIYALILGFAGVLSFPAFLNPPPLYQSWWIDWVWADQFTAVLRSGNIYPRWLPLSHDGLGSPVFYYYGPTAFYLAGMFGLVGLSTHISVLAAFAAALAASGIAAFHWLKGWTNHPHLAALFYMAAPYHVLDFYRRGALAEVVAIAMLPLLALGIRRVSDGRGIVLTAVTYAGMLCTHLPLALLASVLLVAPYALALSRGRLSNLARFIPPLAMGVGLSGLYLVPALALNRYRDASALWRVGFTPAEWHLATVDLSGPTLATLIILCMLAIALPALIILIKWRLPWAIYALAVLATVAGLVPGFWRLPLIELVQFPFRAIPLAELGLATAFAALPRREILGSILAIPALVLSALFISVHAPDAAPSTDLLETRHPDVAEYLPPGVSEPEWSVDWSLEAVEGRLPPPTQSRWTIEPVFYFPSWRVECQGKPVATFPDPGTKLLAHHGKECSRRLFWTVAEQIGAAVSGTTLVMMLLGWRRKKAKIEGAH